MPTPTGLRRKIWSAYILQLAMISIATVAGIYGASVVLKDVENWLSSAMEKPLSVSSIL